MEKDIGVAVVGTFHLFGFEVMDRSCDSGGWEAVASAETVSERYAEGAGA